MPDPAALDPSVRGVLKAPFPEQLDFFRGKMGNLIPTQHWTDVWKSAHDRGFMVAGAAKADLLSELAAAVEAAIAEGEGLGQFRKRFREIVAKNGWTGWTGEGTKAGRAWRTRVIYSTNTSTSYAAGRLAQLKAEGFAWWVYKHSDSVIYPRPLHVAWDGLTLPAGDGWWHTHYPPNGWGCRCYVLGARGPKGAKRLGGDPSKEIDPSWVEIDTKTGEPVGIDRGWGYMPGQTAVDEIVQQIMDKAQALPQPLKAALLDDVAAVATPKSRWDLTTESGLWNAQAFSKAEEWFQDAVAACGDVKVSESKTGSCYFLPGFDEIAMTKNRVRGEKLGDSTWRHEFGHFMDNRHGKQAGLSHYGFRSWASDFQTALEQDRQSLLEKSGMGRTSKKQKKILEDNIRALTDQMNDMLPLDKAGRAERLRELARGAGVDYDEFEAWFLDNAVAGLDTSDDSFSRDYRIGHALVTWGRGDARGFLDAMESAYRHPRLGTRTADDNLAYGRGTPSKLSDLFSATTNKRIEGCGSHTTAYYQQDPRNKNVEAWANLAALAGTGRFGEVVLERFVPRMYEVFKIAIQGALP